MRTQYMEVDIDDQLLVPLLYLRIVLGRQNQLAHVVPQTANRGKLFELRFHQIGARLLVPLLMGEIHSVVVP